MRWLTIMAAWLWIMAVAGCGGSSDDAADAMLDRAYGYRYRNLDSTMSLAARCHDAPGVSGRSRGEALNEMAFVSIARMDYAEAERLLAEVEEATRDDVERAVAHIQMMRVCQRQSRNKDFYIYKSSAWDHLNAADNRRGLLTRRQRQRLEFARSEKAIVESAYYYYVGLDSLSRHSIAGIDPGGTIAKDTAQLLSYYYYMGSGGLVVDSTPQAVAEREFNLLLRCYLLSRQMDFAYWEANAMQGLCEHLLRRDDRERLAQEFPKEIDFINTGNVSLDSLPADLARRSLRTFMDYGDTYQTAGAYRTLAECLWQSADYEGALDVLNTAIGRDSAIMQAPDLVASICEQFSLTYSALDMKAESDRYRNLFLDMQEQTRQDRKLEARAEQLSRSAMQLNIVMAVCALALVVVAVAVVVLALRWGRRSRTTLRERLDDLRERTELSEQECRSNKQRNLEQRAKVALVGEITPLINRICHELDLLNERDEAPELRKERMDYVAELAAKINEYNAVLTDWIQIRQGRLRLHIESFGLSGLFDTVKSNAPEVERGGVTLEVKPTDSIVKADRTLTLFMLNTMIDNARRFTHKGDSITVASREMEDCVEISVSDTGDGMTRDTLDSLFCHTAIRRPRIRTSELQGNNRALPQDEPAFRRVPDCGGEPSGAGDKREVPPAEGHKADYGGRAVPPRRGYRLECRRRCGSATRRRLCRQYHNLQYPWRLPRISGLRRQLHLLPEQPLFRRASQWNARDDSLRRLAFRRRRTAMVARRRAYRLPSHPNRAQRDGRGGSRAPRMGSIRL